MKQFTFLFAFAILLVSCDKKSKTEKQIAEIPIAAIKVERFDKAFFEAPPSELPKLKSEYPEFFPEGTPDTVWINKMKHPLWRELYVEVQKKYSNFEPQKHEIENLYRHIKFYYPLEKTPTVITLINEMDYNSKAIYTNGLILISLELYLGKEHKFYEFPDYIKQNFEPKQIMPDIVSSFAQRKILPPADKTLLSMMVYAGKELYLKDLLLPDYSDADKMGYKPEQIIFCQENESYMWRYFVQEKLLYSNDSKLGNRFINPAPFSKFYLEIDNDTPGRVGAWIGWQIVRSYMKNNEVTVQQLLQTDAVEIFNKSKYKPKKDE
jgi:gliding motility-associated lipoprotein GldB